MSGCCRMVQDSPQVAPTVNPGAALGGDSLLNRSTTPAFAPPPFGPEYTAGPLISTQQRHKIVALPYMLSHKVSFPSPLRPDHVDRALPFAIPDHLRNRVPWENVEQHVHACHRTRSKPSNLHWPRRSITTGDR